jgi:hypothetical protein
MPVEEDNTKIILFWYVHFITNKVEVLVLVFHSYCHKFTFVVKFEKAEEKQTRTTASADSKYGRGVKFMVQFHQFLLKLEQIDSQQILFLTCLLLKLQNCSKS